MRRSLPQVSSKAEGLGHPTIMDRSLALRHGSLYVHLAVFAIDIDRVRDALEDIDDPLPFGWEVFLTEVYLISHVDPSDASHRAMIEDVVLGILEGPSGEAVFGSQLPFAIFDAIERGVFPDDMRVSFAGWRARPKQLVGELAKLWLDARALTPELSRACLDAPMDPPLAAPSIEALQVMAR